MSGLLKDNLPLVASSPNGMKKLREFILQLAIMGKLVPQDINDLVKPSTTSANGQSTKNSAAKGDFPLTQISDEIGPFKIPSTWTWMRLGDIAQLNIGKTPPTKEEKYWSHEGIPWVSISDMELYGTVTKTNRYLTPAVKSTIFKYEPVPAGTLLMSFKLTIGKVSILGVDAYHNEAIVSVVPIEGVLQDYLFRFLPVFSSMGIKKDAIKGATLNSESLSKIPVSIPPLTEQFRIVNKVDELMALCDRLEAQQSDAEIAHQHLVKELLNTLAQSKSQSEFATNWERIKQNFEVLFTTEVSVDALKQALLQLAVMGKLVPQDPSAEPASDLLFKIRQEKEKLAEQGKLPKVKALEAINSELIPFSIPSSWAWAKIGDCTAFTEYGISEKTYELSEGIPVIKMGDIQNGRVVLTGQKKVKMSDEVILLRQNDLLYNRTNSAELVGKTGIFEGPDDQYSFASYLIRIQCLHKLTNPHYLNLVMNTPLFRETQIVPHLKQQCGQANVNGTILRNMLIPVPPFEEQSRIVVKVGELVTLCDELRSQIAKRNALRSEIASTFTSLSEKMQRSFISECKTEPVLSLS